MGMVDRWLGSGSAIPEMRLSGRAASHGGVVRMQVRVIEDVERCWPQGILKLRRGILVSGRYLESAVAGHG